MAGKHVIILGSAYPFRGGLAEFHERLAWAFQQAGDVVEVITFTLQYPGFLFPGKTQFSPDPPPKGLTIERKLHSLNPLSWWQVGQYMRKAKPDLLIAPFWLPFMAPALGTVLRLASKQTRIISLVHNLKPHESRPGDGPLTNYYLKPNQAFVAMSTSVEADLNSWPVNKPVRYIPHPIYDTFGDPVKKAVARKHLKIEEDIPVFLFFGFIRKYKGLDLLLKAIGRSPLREKKFKVLVAGEFYDKKEEYLKLIQELNIEDKILLRDEFIPKEEVPQYFGAADLVVQPYRNATQSGISQMAYHFNKPMLVTHVGGLPEIVDHGRSGYVVDVDPQAIQSALLDFLEQSPGVFDPGIQAKKATFSWANMVAAFHELAKEVS
ncbi:MAG: glycosyltransferase [Bacteroidota bacterium]